MTITFFAGPSLNERDVVQNLENFKIFPPVKYGDIAKLVLNSDKTSVSAIVIIDGYFHQTAAVWHKEILFALAQGIPVYGASSMGALRAAELKSFGMQPHGIIANAYISGSFLDYDDPFEADDEVAFLFGPQELGYPTTLALVDVRWRLHQAYNANDIDFAFAKEALQTMKNTWYQDRTDALFFQTCARLAEKVDIDPDTVINKIKSRSLSLKQDDARSLVEHLANNKPEAYEALFNFEYTQNWVKMVESIE